MKLDSDIDLSLVENIVIRDQMMTPMTVISHPGAHEIDVQATNWAPGIYYVTFDLVEDKFYGKIEIK